jgi:hypothetical protein
LFFFFFFKPLYRPIGKDYTLYSLLKIILIFYTQYTSYLPIIVVDFVAGLTRKEDEDKACYHLIVEKLPSNAAPYKKM